MELPLSPFKYMLDTFFIVVRLSIRNNLHISSSITGGFALQKLILVVVVEEDNNLNSYKGNTPKPIALVSFDTE